MHAMVARLAYEDGTIPLIDRHIAGERKLTVPLPALPKHINHNLTVCPSALPYGHTVVPHIHYENIAGRVERDTRGTRELPTPGAVRAKLSAVLALSIKHLHAVVA